MTFTIPGLFIVSPCLPLNSKRGHDLGGPERAHERIPRGHCPGELSPAAGLDLQAKGAHRNVSGGTRKDSGDPVPGASRGGFIELELHGNSRRGWESPLFPEPAVSVPQGAGDPDETVLLPSGSPHGSLPAPPWRRTS